MKHIYIIGSCFSSFHNYFMSDSAVTYRLVSLNFSLIDRDILIQLFLKIVILKKNPHDVDLSICLCLYFSNEHKNKSFCYEGWHFHLESVSIDLKNQYYRVLKCIKFPMMISAGDIWFVLICRKCCIDDFIKRM